MMKVLDIICNKRVESPSKFFSIIENIRFDFCSAYCKIQFDQDPNYFIDKNLEKKDSMKGDYK